MDTIPPGLAGYIAAQNQANNNTAHQFGLAGQGLGILQGMRQMQYEDQFQPLRIAQMQQALDQATANANLRNMLMGQMGGAVGQSTAGSGQASPSPGGASGAGILGGVSPSAALLMLSGDAGMGKLGSAIQEANKPLSTRYGIYGPDPSNPGAYRAVGGAMPPGALGITMGPNGQPNVGPLPGQLEGTTALTSATKGAEAPYSMQQMKVPVYLPGGDQIEVTMNATQAHQYQTTGQLPPEIAASIPGLRQPTPAGAGINAMFPPAAQAAAAAQGADIRRREVMPNGGGMLPNTLTANPNNRVPGLAAPSSLPQLGGPPVVGRTQSQEEQITQARQQAGGKAVDEQFAKDYVSFTQGGASDAAKQLAQLQDVTNALASPGANLTGPVLGRTPEAIKAFTNPQSIAMKERVDEVVQRSLRAILGAQFTEREGERLIARAYNPSLPESENSIRVGRLFTQLQQAFQAKQSAAQYFEKKGTLQGWQGKLPTMADFDPISGGATGSFGDMSAIDAEIAKRGLGRR